MGLLDRWSKKNQTERLEKKSEPKSEPVAEAKPAEVKEVKKTTNNILVRALVTEKSAIKQSENKYSFIVVKNANKAVIKKAIEEVYKIKPLSVNVINVQGKAMRFGKHSGKRSDFKKAIVTLPKGKTIVIHEGV